MWHLPSRNTRRIEFVKRRHAQDLCRPALHYGFGSWTQFVGRLGFRINLASLHADLSIPTAYLTVIYREKALPSRGRFIISARASEAAENVDSQEQEEE
jgi:hypothetical protein